VGRDKVDVAGNILLAFYGDDFSGTTATAEALFTTGTPTVVFSEPPDLVLLSHHFPRVLAVGVAGLARTMSVEELSRTLRPAFRKFATYHSPIILYKVCSTFDSSENAGSIGKAIEIGREIFSSNFIPMLPGAPRLGRYTVFGHHFAALGRGEVFRLDRHPSMSTHPVTPMREADLRLHLSRQTSLRSTLISILDLNRGEAHVNQLLRDLKREDTPIVLFDCLEERHLRLVCQVVWKAAREGGPVFFVGSQELGYGLGEIWKTAGLLAEEGPAEQPAPIHEQPILVLSGSCATVTGGQIRWARENGFAEIVIHPEALLDPATRRTEQTRISENCLNELGRGRSVVAHTAAGPEDERILGTREKAARLSISANDTNRIIGDALGEIARGILEHCAVRRMVVSGGDTAGRVQKHLDLLALQIARPIGIAAPICYLYSSNRTLNGMEVAFKGGQIGNIDYFGQVRTAAVRGFSEEALGSFPQTRELPAS